MAASADDPEVVAELRSLWGGTDTDDVLPRRVELALSDVDLLTLGPTTMRVASRLPVRHLKFLDAIHVASALITRCDVVLTRDRQLARACEELGLAVA